MFTPDLYGPIARRACYVRPDVARAAVDMAWSASLDLQLRAPGDPLRLEIEFGHPGIMQGAHGLFSTKTYRIRLHHNLNVRRMAEVTAHELRHYWQWTNWSPDQLDDREAVEADARRYEKNAIDRFFRLERYWPDAPVAGAVRTDDIAELESEGKGLFRFPQLLRRRPAPWVFTHRDVPG